jgi:hypothetical protein
MNDEETLMECREPGVIRDEELFAYLAGERVRPAVAQHLATCPSCMEQAATYRNMDRTLTSTLYRWNCPPSQVLGDYQFGLLAPNQSTEVRSHVSTCAACTSELAVLSTFLANDPWLEARPAVQVAARQNSHPVQSAKRALENLRDQSLESARRIAATFVPSQPRLASQRDAASQIALWPRSYTAEDLNISIQVERGVNRRDALQVIGFVTRKGAALEALDGTPVQLLASSSVTGTTEIAHIQKIDDLGNFVFSQIVPATYVLELQLPEGVVVIDQLPVSVQD